MKRFATGILLLFALVGTANARDVIDNDLYTIYERTDGEIFFDLYWDKDFDKDDLGFKFHYGQGRSWIGIGYSDGNTIILYDLEDEDAEDDEKYLTLTCSNPDKHGNFLTITVKGSKAFGKRFDGKYKAYQGHV